MMLPLLLDARGRVRRAILEQGFNRPLPSQITAHPETVRDLLADYEVSREIDPSKLPEVVLTGLLIREDEAVPEGKIVFQDTEGRVLSVETLYSKAVP